MTVMVCRECGERNVLRSRFDGVCLECGSEDLDPEGAYDNTERELKCEQCGFEIDTTTGPDRDWADGRSDTPRSVDDPCPICSSALVPRAEAGSARDIPEYKLAREAARKLHREHQIVGPPYTLEPLAEALGLEVAVGPFGHDGLIVGERIEIPATASATVRRFALAHEIGHYVLRHEGERAKLEPEANAFASELLVPRTSLTAALATTPSIRALTARFGVSRQAMVYALLSARAIGQVTA